jgi:IclR family KDG regulon transcriptional repressor
MEGGVNNHISYMKGPFHMRNAQPKVAGNSATPAVLKALAILESFDAEHPAQSLADLSRKLGIAKASAFRNLKALEKRGYVTKSSRDGTYSLGVRILDLARRFLEQNHLLSIGSSHIAELSRTTGETSHLAILDGPEIVYVDVSQGSQLIRAVVSRGDRLPAHCVASGKAILAHSPRERVMEFLARGLNSLTPRTISSPDDFITDLERIREKGYATNIGEWSDDVSAIACPVFSHQGIVVGAIGIAGPRLRLGAKTLSYLASAIQSQAARLSADLGGTVPSRQGASVSKAAVNRQKTRKIGGGVGRE